jgi:hypothetical protein
MGATSTETNQKNCVEKARTAKKKRAKKKNQRKELSKTHIKPTRKIISTSINIKKNK